MNCVIPRMFSLRNGLNGAMWPSLNRVLYLNMVSHLPVVQTSTPYVCEILDYLGGKETMMDVFSNWVEVQRLLLMDSQLQGI